MNSRRLTSLLVVVLFMIPLVAPFISIPVTEAAAGTISINPTKFSSGVPTTAVLNGGIFGSGATVRIFMSPNPTFGDGDDIGPVATVTLPAGQTSFINTVVTINTPTVTVDTEYYLAATDDDGRTWTSPVKVVVTTQRPLITLTPTTQAPGGSVRVDGRDFTPGQTVTIYLERPGGTILASGITVRPDGTFTATFTVPAIAQGDYRVIAQQADTLQAEALLTIAPTVEAPFSIRGAAGETFTLIVKGLKPGKTVAPSTTADPRANIVIGGVLTYHGGGSTGPAGTLSIPVTLSAAIPTTGFVSVTIIYTDGTSDTIPRAILVSRPQDPARPAFTQDIEVSPPPGPLSVGATLSVVVYNFPAGTAVDIFLGSRKLTTITTDGNGAGRATPPPSVPPLPGLTPGGTPITYSIRAVDTHGLRASLSGYRIASELRLFIDTTLVTSETYVDHGAVLRLVGTGLRPLYEYRLTLSFPGVTYDIVVDRLVVDVPRGTLTATGVRTDATGSFEVRFRAHLADPAGARPPTGTTVTVSMSPGEGLTAPTFRAVGVPTFAGTLYTVMAGAAFYHSEPGAAVPAGGVVIRNLVPGRAYQLFIGGSPVTLGGTGYADRFIATAGGESPGTMTFAAPPSPGVYMLCVRYYLATADLACIAFIVSRPTADTADDRAILVTPTRPAGLGILVRAFNLPADTPVSLFVSGITTPVATARTTATGAVAMWSTGLDLPRGDYLVRLEYGPNVLVPTPSKVTITPRLTRSPASGPIGTSVSVTAMGLDPNTAYRVVFEGAGVSVDVASGVSNDRGTLTATFTVPPVSAGDYIIKVVDVATGETLAAATFRVTPPSGLVLKPNPTAFPGQLVVFEWDTGVMTLVSPVYVTVILNDNAYTTFPARYEGTKLYGSFLMPNAPPGTTWALRLVYSDSRVITTTYTVVSYKTQTEFFTGDGSTTTFRLTFPPVENSERVFVGGFLQVRDTDYTIDYETGEITFTTAPAPGAIITVIYDAEVRSTVEDTRPAPQTGSIGPVVIRLISGSGALVVSLTDDDVFRIASAVQEAVYEAIYDPIVEVVTRTGDRVLARLSDLNATIVEVRGGVALLNTRFGEMFASLSAINATLSGLIVSSKGEVLAKIDTALGTVLARLDDLDAKLVAVHLDTAEIKTVVGDIKLALGSLNATIAGIKDDVVVIKTNAGFIKAKVDEFLALLPSIVLFVNATVTDIKSGIAAVKDDTGFIKAKVEDVIALLSAASATLSNVAGNVSAVRSDIAAVRSDIAEVKALLLEVNTNVSSVAQAVLTVADQNKAVLDKLDEINATLVGVSGGVAKLSTDVDGLASLVKAANLSISQVVVDQAGRVIATLRDSEDRISGLITTLSTNVDGLATLIRTAIAAGTEAFDKVMTQLTAISGKLDTLSTALETAVTTIKGDIAATEDRIRGDIAGVRALVLEVNTNVGFVAQAVLTVADQNKAVLDKLDEINATLVGVSGGVAKLSTDVDGLASLVKAANLSISQVVVDQAGRVIATLRDSEGRIVGAISTLSTNVDGLASLVKAANLSISQVVVDQAGRVIATLRDSEGRIVGAISTNAKTLSDLITAVGKDVAGVATSVKTLSDTLATFQSGAFSKLDAISGSVDAARADLARLRTDAAAMASVVAGIQTTVSRVDTNVGGLVDTAKAIATTVDSINRAVPGLATKADVSGAQTAITGAIDKAKSDLQSAVKSAEDTASTSSRNWGVINTILIIIAIAILAYATFVARRA